MRIAAMWPRSYKQGVVIMRQPGLPLVITMLVLTAACGNEVPVGPTSSPAPPDAGLAQPVPDAPGQPPYTVTGTVLDSRGAPVAGAEIWIYGNDSPIDNRYGVSFADDAGRYRVTSATRVPHAVRAMKDGYVRRDVPICVSSTSPWDVDVRLQHIDRYQLIGPSDIVAGESSRLQARVDLDDGSTETGSLYVELSSDDSAVLDIQPTGWITGVAPGVATIAARYYGAATTLLIRVTAKK